MKIGLTYDLREEYLAAGYRELETAEFDRADTIEALCASLSRLGHEPVRIGNIRQLAKCLVEGQSWDLVFNIAEGLEGFGREAQVPALLEAYRIPYTFSDTLVSALTLHKGHCKRIVQSYGLATPDFAVINTLADIARVGLAFPLFAKPIAEGTGKGITPLAKVMTKKELQKVCSDLLQQYRQPVLVETFLTGREFTVGITGTGADAVVVGTAEIILLEGSEAEVYSYFNKENCEEVVHYKRLAPGLIRRNVEHLALLAWQCLGCRDAGRIDIRMDDNGTPQFLEVNPLAGIHPEHSDLPILASLEGISYDTLILRILDSACRRYKLIATSHDTAA